MYNKLVEQADKELREIEEKGLNSNNYEAAGELIDIILDDWKIEKCRREMEESRYGGNYQYGTNYTYGRYDDTRYGRYDGGTYRGYDEKEWRRSRGIEKPFEYMMEDIEDGVVTYHEGRGRMRYGAADDKTLDGLDKMMHGISALVDATMGMAQTEQEKEIVRKHLQKLKSM